MTMRHRYRVTEMYTAVVVTLIAVSHILERMGVI